MDFQKIVEGMTGQQFMESINGNFELTKEQINTLAANILLRLISNNVKQIKVENNKMYYTLDDTTWKPVDVNTWGSITGDITNQTDLQTILNSKAPSSSLDKINSDVNTLSNKLSGLTTSVSTNSSNIQQNTKSIGELQSSNATKVSSPTIVAFRISSSGFLQYTIDNVAWINVQSIAEINWGAIGGEISNQIDLKEQFDSKVKQSDFDSHVSNKENPHEVTKSQVGLSEVDNTSDENKPISIAQKEKFNSIDALISELKSDKLSKSDEISDITYITLEDYNAAKEAGTLNDTTIYIVN